ncbi:hypothetical protein D3C87_1829710 [compost metagenome]
MIAQDRVFTLLEAQHEPHVVAVLGYMCHADAAQLRRIVAGDRLAVDEDLA